MQRLNQDLLPAGVSFRLKDQCVPEVVQLFGGGGGAGVSISPIAFLVVRGNSVRMLQLADTSNSVDRAIGMMPEMVDKVADLFGKNKKDDDGTAR